MFINPYIEKPRTESLLSCLSMVYLALMDNLYILMHVRSRELFVVALLYEDK